MILRDLTSDEMAAVEKIAVVRGFAAGDYIIHEGEAGSSFFLILEGRVEVRKSIGLDKYKKLIELGSLDIFGEICFLGVESRSASVMAREPTKVMEFSQVEFDKLIVRQPAIGLKLYRGIARELAQRLAAVNGELKDAIVWALGDLKTSMDPAVISSRKLTVLSPPSVGVPARIVKV
ncbi:MAG: cyclic nucleotide-binding domain-containing protein [bacterium]